MSGALCGDDGEEVTVDAYFSRCHPIGSDNCCEDNSAKTMLGIAAVVTSCPKSLIVWDRSRGCKRRPRSTDFTSYSIPSTTASSTGLRWFGLRQIVQLAALPQRLQGIGWPRGTDEDSGRTAADCLRPEGPALLFQIHERLPTRPGGQRACLCRTEVQVSHSHSCAAEGVHSGCVRSILYTDKHRKKR